MHKGCFSGVALTVLAFANVASARDVDVADVAALGSAISAAQPGDRIVLADGTYALSASPTCRANGTATSPIVVVAKTPLGAKIRMTTTEGFKVTGAYWRFEGLDITGACTSDDTCEHAFHVTGAAKGVVLRKNRIVDFNAQLKANAERIDGRFVTPDDLLVEENEIFDTRPRKTGNPTTKLNIDTGDRVIVRANYIHDYQKDGGDGVSYAAFMKSGGKDGIFERNLVVCAKAHTGGTRIGLSFGGGGTGNAFCAPAFDASVPCDPEHSGGTLRNNVIASCSDVGIYLNESKDTKVLFNTLVATNGIDFRYGSSTGVAIGNVLAGKVRGREGGTFTASENLQDVSTFEAMFVDPASGNLAKKGDLAALVGKGTSRPDVADDYCARARAGAYDLGALQVSLGDCASALPAPGVPGVPGTPGTTPPGPSGTTPIPGSPSAPGETPSATEADSGCSLATGAGSTGAPIVAVAGAIVVAWQRRRRHRVSV